MSVPIDTLITEVLPGVIGCPEILIQQELLNTLQDFCGATWIINRAVLATSTTAVNVNYALENYEICHILRLKIDHIEWTAKRREAVDDTDDMNDIKEYRTKFWYPGSGGVITLMPFDTPPTEIRMRVAFRPTMQANMVEDKFYDDWHDTIVAGTKAALMLMPKMVWTDPQYGKYFDGKYIDGKDAAFQRVQNSLDINPRTKFTGAI